jgi:hypothetical protein
MKKLALLILALTSTHLFADPIQLTCDDSIAGKREPTIFIDIVCKHNGCTIVDSRAKDVGADFKNENLIKALKTTTNGVYKIPHLIEEEDCTILIKKPSIKLKCKNKDTRKTMILNC